MNPPESLIPNRIPERWRWLFAIAGCLGLAIASPPLRAQSFDATNLRVPAELGATGVFIGGDDPAFAHPNYDDSKWLSANDKRPVRMIIPSSQPEIVWQRIHVKVSPDETGLAVKAFDVADAFELFVNGQKLLESGRFAPLVRYTEGARLVARIPDAQIATGNLVIAIRERTRPTWWRQSSDVAFFAEMLSLGEETALTDHVRLGVIYPNAFGWLVQLMGIGVSVVALALFTAQRQQKEYLWLALQGGSICLDLPIEIIQSLRNIPAWVQYLYPLSDGLLNFFTALMVFAFVHRKLRGWLRIYIVLSCISIVLVNWVELSDIILPAYYRPIIDVPFFAIFAIVIPAVLISDLRCGNRGARILLIPVVSWCVSNVLWGAEIVMGIVPRWHAAGTHLAQTMNSFAVGPFIVNTGSVTAAIGYVSLTVIMVLRSTQTSRQQAVFEGELEAARQVQQVILPEQIEAIPGFIVESVYQPAQQVGGDFFQVLPTDDLGLLLVIGDVAGKGLPAAMLVSVLVGSIRTVAEDTHDPQIILRRLNERLIGRTRGGFSTALAAQITADGAVTIANAGHLSPYLDGQEIELPGALPLGVVSGASYETFQFQLSPGSRLTFYSDGVIEAQSEKGELFGFERGREISTKPAAAIVEAAKQFGQSDDITVVAITRVAAIATAA
ncbi:PP2C family protein-serine/threonine phosphatase [Acidicapsa acidisoli]|uniref:PP2C family protein-serine/threonine phosphatase n=1 Tax=Acidicapsa acidisoli TaxID=1615681 RepID=UPI0021DF5C49|nr:PP2C family protein-serine/threonine phosphatase [Acidicapsa acidisoli]